MIFRKDKMEAHLYINVQNKDDTYHLSDQQDPSGFLQTYFIEL